MDRMLNIRIQVEAPGLWRDRVTSRLHRTLHKLGIRALVVWRDQEDPDQAQGPCFELGDTPEEEVEEVVRSVVILALANAAAEDGEQLAWQIWSRG